MDCLERILAIARALKVHKDAVVRRAGIEIERAVRELIEEQRALDHLVDAWGQR